MEPFQSEISTNLQDKTKEPYSSTEPYVNTTKSAFRFSSAVNFNNLKEPTSLSILRTFLDPILAISDFYLPHFLKSLHIILT